MSAVLELGIEGIGVYAPGMPSWDAACEVLADGRALGTEAFVRPAPALLAVNERRRAPDSVLLALAVAEQACAMARRAPRDLANVFASSYGDLPINDYLCAVLANAPTELSPTKFHNSVHNAPAGYWTIASGCMASSTAVSAGPSSFAAGLLEAAMLAVSENAPVLYAAFDVPASGPLAEVIACDAPFAVAFVLAPLSLSPLPP
ncbi:MAG: beta-ketoacyl synthase chain length factor, partial [Proteobacteria bacterium]|nr:beta-ketoacyl synthase chain length factor [Pseudomonadota bacterium]